MNEASAPGQAATEEVASKGRSATRSEKITRFLALTNADYGRLLKWAEFIALKFRGRVTDADAQDLLHHSILQSLEDSRHWYLERVDFFTFVRGCIRSVGYAWYRGAKLSEAADMLASPVNQQEQTDAAITLEKARACLHRHPHALRIFDLMREGRKGYEIRQILGITEEVYEAAYKWLFRTLRREGYRQ